MYDELLDGDMFLTRFRPLYPDQAGSKVAKRLHYHGCIQMGYASLMLTIIGTSLYRENDLTYLLLQSRRISPLLVHVRVPMGMARFS